MGFVYRRSYKIVPGLHLNVSKRGMGVSLGARKGPRLSIGPTGRVTETAHIAKGLRYQRTVSLRNNVRQKPVPHTDFIPPSTATVAALDTTAIEHTNPHGDSVHNEHEGFWFSYGFMALVSFGLTIAVSSRGDSHPALTGYLGIVSIVFFGLFLHDKYTARKERRATVGK